MIYGKIVIYGGKSTIFLHTRKTIVQK